MGGFQFFLRKAPVPFCRVKCTLASLCTLYTGFLYPWYALMIPMHNAHPYFLSKIWPKTVCIIHGKIWYLNSKGPTRIGLEVLLRVERRGQEWQLKIKVGVLRCKVPGTQLCAACHSPRWWDKAFTLLALGTQWPSLWMMSESIGHLKSVLNSILERPLTPFKSDERPWTHNNS